MPSAPTFAGSPYPSPSRGEVSEGRRGRDAPPDPITLQLTQLLIDPTDVPDRDGEWVELHNPTPLPADLRDVAVAVNGTTRCDLSGVTLPAYGYLLIARTDLGGRFPCAGLSLPNKGGEVALVRCGEVLDVVVWERAPKGARISGSQRPLRSSSRPPS